MISQKTATEYNAAEENLDRECFDRTPYYSSVETTRLDEELRWDAYNEISEFHRRLINHPDLVLAHPSLISALSGIERFNETDTNYGPPDRIVLNQAREQIWKLPDSVRMRILNGWRLCPPNTRRSRENIELEESYEGLYSGLVIEAGGTLGIDGYHADWRNSTTAPVQFRIRVGTTKAEAMGLLKLAMEKLEAGWDAMIAGTIT